MSLTETLPLDHWTNFFKLAQMGMLRIDQLFQKTQALVDQGMPAEAIQLYLAYATQPASEKRHMALYNLGSLQQAQGDMPGAEASYRACIALDPSLGQALVNLGLLLEKTGRKQEALEQWNVVANPVEGGHRYDTDIQTMALNHIGRVYENHKQYDEAERALERSLALNTKQTGVLQHWIHIRQKACAWPVYKPLPGITHNEMLMATSPLAMLAMTDDPVQQLLTAHAFVGRTYGFKEEFLCKGRVYTHDRIRIGYVSGDLCTHAVGLLLPEVFEGHDRTKFEVYAYDFSPEDGTAVRARLKASFDHLRRIDTLTDRQVAELVLQDEIDVLIDLHGLSSGARPGIFALHPAPKQGTYLGFIGTTGMPWFDFVIADKYVLPEELTPYFTEKPLYVEGSFIPLTKPASNTVTTTRAEHGLPDDAFVMAAFGNVYKITPEMFSTWLEILQEIPESILWLIDDNAATTRNLRAFATDKKADLSRIIFSARTAHSEYLAKLALADVFLDTFPYNCGSTSNDVIGVNVSIITLAGRTMVSRMGLSILSHLGQTSLISRSLEEYKLNAKRLHLSRHNTKELAPTITPNKNSYSDAMHRFNEDLKTINKPLKIRNLTFSPAITLITHHYNGHKAAQSLLDCFSTYDKQLMSNFKIIIVDDFSDHISPINPHYLDLKHLRVLDDIPWNQAGCRNLGALTSTTEWSLFFDIDQVPSEFGLKNIIENIDSLEICSLYYFNVENFIDSNLNTELKVHPNTFLVHTDSFRSKCMYDEDFAGRYGYEDLYLPYVWEKYGGIRQLYGEQPFFKDQGFKTAKLSRSSDENHTLALTKINSGIKKPSRFIRFQWETL